MCDKKDKNEARKVKEQEGCKRLKGQLRVNEEQSQLYEDQEMYHKQKSGNQVQIQIIQLSEWKIKDLRM